MPRQSVEPQRRQALIGAAIEAIHDAGFRDVTMGQIARRAGVSTALAHHYFGSKEHLLAETMRHLLREFGAGVAARLGAAKTPRARLSVVVEASFDAGQFRPSVVSAWLAFYLHAHTNSAAHRLLKVYVRRLRSNLVHDLAALVDRARAADIADGMAAMIDGLWIRHALGGERPDPARAVSLVEGYVSCRLGENEQ